MEQKPGWTYYFKNSLNQHIAVNNITNVLYVEDKTMYTAEESNLLKSIDYNLPLFVHQVKKLFEGTLIEIK